LFYIKYINSVRTSKETQYIAVLWPGTLIAKSNGVQCEMERSWNNSHYYPDILQRRLSKTMKVLSQDSLRSPSSVMFEQYRSRTRKDGEVLKSLECSLY
jgi:hypothetical protein